MICESVIQQLSSLKSNPDFINFLEYTNSSLSEFEGVMIDAIGINSKSRPFAAPFMDQAEQLKLNLMACFKLKLQPCPNFFIANKEETESPITSEDCSETDVSIPHTSGKDQIFKVIKSKGPGMLRISLRTDCIRKKVKSMFHKFVITKLNKHLHQTTKSTSFKPLPKILSISLNLRENKRWTDMSLKELMITDSIQQSGFDSINKLHNQNVLREEKSDALNAYLDTKWKTVFEEFLLSSELSKAINDMEKINPIYATRFRKHSSTFLRFIEH